MAFDLVVPLVVVLEVVDLVVPLVVVLEVVDLVVLLVVVLEVVDLADLDHLGQDDLSTQQVLYYRSHRLY